jgi:hypothetical protein
LFLEQLMDLSFNQIETVFAKRFDIPEGKVIAFRARLQHFQRLKFPSEVNTGRGKKASYGWMQTIQLMVALDLVDLGITPEVAAKSVRASTDRLVTAIYGVVSKFESVDALAKAMKKARCPFGITQIALASSYALTFPRPEDEPPLITCLEGREFTDRLNKDPAFEPAASFINLGARMMAVGQLVGRTAGLDPIELAIDLLEWSADWAHQDTLS